MSDIPVSDVLSASTAASLAGEQPSRGEPTANAVTLPDNILSRSRLVVFNVAF